MKKFLAIIFCLMMLVGCQAPKSEIKDYVLASIDDATAYFDEKGIPYIISYAFNNEVEKGFVVSQEITTEGYKEETVLLVVSKGKEMPIIEDLTDVSEEKSNEDVVNKKDESYSAEKTDSATPVQKPATKPSTQNNNTNTDETSKSDNNNAVSNDKTSTSNNKDAEVEKPSSQPTEDKKEYQVGDVIQTEAGNNLKYNGQIEKEDGTMGDSWTMISGPNYEIPDTEKVVELEDGTKVTQEVINAGWEAPDNLPPGAVFVGEAEISDVEDFLNSQGQ